MDKCGYILVRTDKGISKLMVGFGRRFMRYIVVKTACPHKYFGIFMVNIRAQATSNKGRFFLSDALFRCGVLSFDGKYHFSIDIHQEYN